LSELDQLVALSQAAGALPDWAQAAGGNTSVKGPQALYLKASGVRLSEMSPAKGWVSLDRAKAWAVLNDRRFDSLPHAQQQDEAGREMFKALLPGSPQGRPSLEAEFHLLGAKVCLHVHLVEALAGLSLKHGQAWFQAALKNSGLAWTWVDYRPPGHALARLVQAALTLAPRSSLVLMKNHGVIAYADGITEATALVERLQTACKQALGSLSPAPLAPVVRDNDAGFELAEALGPQALWKWSSDPWVSSLAVPGASPWVPLCPDDGIYVGLSVPQQQSLNPAPFKGQKRAAIALMGLGVLLAAQDQRNLDFLEEMLRASTRAAALGRRVGDLEPLTEAQCLTLMGMDGEKYRQGPA
jgi:rhamnose utilization protein RhaD (predicted bifunctional aldolase and dehydrogenase)